MNRRECKDCIRICYWILIGIGLMFTAVLFSSCRSTRYIPVETVRTETQYKDRLVRDSIHIQDSIFMYMKGDTIFRDRWHTEYRNKLIHDTTYIYKTDSIQIPYPVEKKLTKWQNLKIELGGWMFGGLLLALIIITCIVFMKIKNK